MGKFFTLTKNHKPNSEPRRRGRFRLSFPRLSGTLGYAVAVLLVLASFGYFSAANSVATMGYEINNLEKELVELKEDQKKLEIEAAALKTIESIEGEIQALNLVPSGEIKYVRNTSLTVSD